MKRKDIQKSNWGKIVNDSMGSFLDPPNYPQHNYSVHSLYGDTFGLSLEGAVECDWLDDETKEKVVAILKDWNKLPLNDVKVQDWIHQVMGYFCNCYQAGAGSWDADKLIIDKNLNAIDNQDKHAGVHLIRRFYPEFKLTEENLSLAYWGRK